MKRTCLLFTALSLIVGAAPAAVISLNCADPRIDMATTDVAGAAERVGYWNNFRSPGDFATMTLTYDDGSEVGGSFSITGSGGTPAQVDNGTVNDARMYSGQEDMKNGETYSLSFTDIPFAQYDIYVYTRGTSSTRGGSISDGSETFYVRSGSIASDDGTGYTLITTTTYDPLDPGAGVAAGNYVLFDGLSGADQTITLTVLDMGNTDIQRLSFAGIQIVEVTPEPATLGLLGLGGLALLRRRRRKA